MTEIEKLRKEIEALHERWDIEADGPGREGIQAAIGRRIIKAQQHLITAQAARIESLARCVHDEF